jgi:Protein of unknown function (DUF2971)
MQNRPSRLFRFLPSGAETILTDRKLWCSSPQGLNDPFDTSPSWQRVVDKFVKKHQRKVWQGPTPRVLQEKWKTMANEAAVHHARGFQDKLGKNLQIVCFSSQLNSIPMWSHYASGHRGFVLEFEPDHPLLSNHRFRRVRYMQRRPAFSGGRKEDYEMLFRKSPAWRPESEWRMMIVHEDSTEGVQPWTKELGRYIPLPPNFLKAVYFGCRAPRSLLESIQQSIQCPELAHVELFEMTMESTKFRLSAGKFQPTKQGGYFSSKLAVDH